MKKCTKCKETKSESEFGRNPTAKNGLRSSCRSCISIYNNSRVGLRKKPFDPLKAKFESAIHRKYGITTQEYLDLMNKQNSSCAICGKHQMDLKKKLHIDHCHTTGRVRGLLCHHCNTRIGYLRDSKEIVTKALEYLCN